MKKDLSPAQIARQRPQYREDGRYAKVNPCYVCDKSAGVDYYSHPDSDMTINDELLCLCKNCMGKYQDLPGPEAVKLAFAKEQ